MKTIAFLVLVWAPVLCCADSMSDADLINAYEKTAEKHYLTHSTKLNTDIFNYTARLKKERSPYKAHSIKKSLVQFKSDLRALEKNRKKGFIPIQYPESGAVGYPFLSKTDKPIALLEAKVDSENAIYKVSKTNTYLWVEDTKTPVSIQLDNQCIYIGQQITHKLHTRTIKAFKVRFVDIEKLIRMQRANKGSSESTPELQALKQELAALKKRSLAGISQEERILIIKRRKELEKRIRGLD